MKHKLYLARIESQFESNHKIREDLERQTLMAGFLIRSGDWGGWGGWGGCAVGV